MKKLLTLLLATTLLLPCFSMMLPARATEAEKQKVTAQKPLRLWYDTPVDFDPTQPVYPEGGTAFDPFQSASTLPKNYKSWMKQALPIGNGHMGGMVLGGVTSEVLQFNEKTLWTGGPGSSEGYMFGISDTAREVGYSKVQAAREALANGALWLGWSCLSGIEGERLSGFGRYQNFGELTFMFDDALADYTDYERWLDLRTGTVGASFKVGDVTYEREYLANYPDNVIAVRFSASEKNAVSVATGMLSAQGGTTVASVEDGIGILSLAGAVSENGMKYESVARVIAAGGTVTVADNKIQVSGADSVVILMTAGTDYKNEYPTYRGEDPHDAVIARLDAAMAKGYDSLRQRHLDDYQEIFSRVELDLGHDPEADVPTDELLNGYKKGIYDDRALEVLAFQYGRYLLIASSREGSLPANLQGVWNHCNNPPWRGDYHMDINIQMNYWPAYVTNMAETAIPLVEYVDSLRESGRESAAILFDIKSEAGEENGFILTCMSNPFGKTFLCNNFDWQPAANAWISDNLWEYYTFTQDKEYLKNEIYPIIREAAVFWTQALQELDGRLVSSPSMSEEQGQFTAGCTQDQELIWQLYTNVIEASKILDTDEELRALLIEQREKLDPLHVSERGTLKEWYDEDAEGFFTPEAHHRHTSHLVGAYPGRHITADTPVYAEAVKQSLIERGMNVTAWPAAHRFCLWARLEEGEIAYDMYTRLIGGFTENLLNAKFLGTTFQTDANMGSTAGVAEMLLQSHAGAIVPLAAMPAAWADGSYQGLVARGNFETDATWANGILTAFTVRSGSGLDCVISYPGIGDATVTCNGQSVDFTVSDRGDTITFATKKGAEYQITELPKSPEDGIAVRKNFDEVELCWSAVEGAESYHVYRSTDGENFELVAANLAETEYVDYTAGYADGTVYQYRLVAVCARGNELNPGPAFSEKWDTSVRVTSVEIFSPTGVTTLRGAAEQLQLQATVAPQTAVFRGLTWSIADENGDPTAFATVTQDGLVKASGLAGSAKLLVTATATDGSGVSDTFALQFAVPESSATANLFAGLSMKLTQGTAFGTVSGVNLGDVKWLTDGFCGNANNDNWLERFSLSSSSANPIILDVTLPEATDVSRIKLYERTHTPGDPSRISGIEVQVSYDAGATYTSIGSVSDGADTQLNTYVDLWTIETKTAKPAQYLRLIITGNRSDMVIWEIEGYSSATAGRIALLSALQDAALCKETDFDADGWSAFEAAYASALAAANNTTADDAAMQTAADTLCDAIGDVDLTPVVESISIQNTDITLALGAKRALTVCAAYDRGETQDVTAFASFMSENAAIASVGADGVITAAAVGKTVVTATYAGMTAQVTVNVMQNPDGILIAVAGEGGTVTKGSTPPYVAGQQVSLTAIADVGYTFLHWLINDTEIRTGTVITVVAGEDKLAEAVFIRTEYVDGTGKTVGAHSTLEAAITALPENGGRVIVCGDTTVGTDTALSALPAKNGKVAVLGANGAKLIIGYGITLGGETEFDNIELCNGFADAGFLYALGNKLTVGENVTTTVAEGVQNHLTLFGGHPDKDVASTHLVVKSGTYKDIYGANRDVAFTGNAKVEVSNITVTNVLSAKSVSGFAGTAELVLDLRDGKTVTATCFVEPTFRMGKGYEAVLTDKTYSQQIIDTVYVDGTGATEGAFTTLKAAVAALPDEGGTVIVCGDTTVGTVAAAVYLPAKSGKIAITSEDGAKLTIAYGIKLGCETEIDNIELVNISTTEGFICALGNKLTVGENVTTSVNGTTRYLTIRGGNNVSGETTSYDAHVVVQSGTWRYIFGGSKGTFNGDSYVEVSDVTVTNTLSAKNEGGTFNGTGTLVADLRGNKTVTASTYKETPTFLLDNGYKAELDGTTYRQQLDGPAYVDGTGKTAGAYTSFITAYNALPDAGGQMIICGDTAIDTTTLKTDLAAKSGKVTVTGQNGAKLIVARRVNLGCEMEIDNIDLCCAAPEYGYIYAQGHKLTIGANVTTTQAAGTSRWITLFGGGETDFASAHLVVKAGTYNSIYGGNFNAAFSGVATVEVSNVIVKNTLSAKSINTGAFTGTPNLTVDLRGGKTVTATTYVGTLTTLVDDGYEAVLDGMTYRQEKTAQIANTVYLDGTGATEGAYATLETAITALPDTGGTVILCGDTVLGDANNGVFTPAKSGAVRVIGQADTNGVLPKLSIARTLHLEGDLSLDNLNLCNASAQFGYIYARGHKLTLGENISTSIGGSATTYPWVFGGHHNADVASTHLVILAGTYNCIYGANFGATFTGTSKVEVSNVKVVGTLSAESISNFKGTAELILDLRNDKTVTAATFVKPTFLVDNGYEAVLTDKTYSQQISDTVCVDGTGKTDGAYTTLESAIEALPIAGGKVIVSGDTTVGEANAAVTLPTKSGKVTITGKNGAKLKIAYGVVLGSETEIDNVELVNVSAGQGYIAADGNKLTIGENMITSRENTERWLTILGGNKTSTATSYDTDVTIKAGTYRYIFGGNSTAAFNGNATVEVSNVVVTKLSAANEGGTFNGTATLVVNLCGNKTVTATTYAQTPTVLVDDGYRAVLDGNIYSQRKVVAAYISASTGADTNDGLTAATPKATLDSVTEVIRNGGRLILTGDLYTDDEYVWNLGDSTTVTAENNGFWRLENGAKLTVWSNLTLDDMLFTHGGDTTIRVDRAVFAVTDTVDLTAAGGKHTLIIEENAVAILSEAAQEFFTIEGEGEVITYNSAEGIVIPTEYSNGGLLGIYGSKGYVEYIAKNLVPAMRYESGEDFAEWKKDVSAKLNEVLGLPLTKSDADLFRIISKTEHTDYTRVDFEFQSEPNYFVPATMLIPVGATGKQPCVITLQGHTTGMHISLGETKFSGDVTTGNDYALQAVSNGMIAVAIDQRYMGAAGQDSTGKATCRGGTTVNTVLYGRTVIGERVWDVQRLIDILYTHFGDFVDEENLICLGNEAGGMTAFFASALDERIKISVPASAISTYETSIIAKRPCCCYDIPGFEKYFDMGDVGMLIAPRKLLVVSGKTDSTFPIAGAEESFARMQSAYTMLGAADNCTHLIGNGGSGLYADEAWPIIRGYLAETKSDSTATAADITVSTAATGITKIYDSTKYIQHIGRNVEPLLRYHDGEDFAEWQKNAKAKLVELLGMPTEKCTDDHFRILKETKYDTYTRMDFEFQSEENYFVRGSILIPAGATGKLPCAITLQGHTAGMHISLDDTSNISEVTSVLNGQDFATRAVREGIIGVAIEQRYMGTAGVGGSCSAHATMNTHLYGRTAIGERIWDVSRTIDILEKYFSDSIDFDKLILMGNSGGGTATFYASCVEDRIKISVPSCAFSTYMDSIVVQWHCRCNYIPGVAKYFDMGDVSMLIAPKKLLLVSGRTDSIFPIVGAKAQFAITQKAYDLLGASEDCKHLVGNDGHRFFVNEAWPILHEYLGTEREEVTTVYVDGTGATPGAYAKLGEAISRLPDSGGTVIVCGDTMLGAVGANVTEVLPPKSGKVTVTGVNGAKLIIPYVLFIGSETEFNNIDLCNASTVGYIYACGNKLTIGENVTTSRQGTENWLMVFGGYSNLDCQSTHLVVQSGTYRNVYGANFNASFTGISKVEISGVTVTGTLSAKSVSNFKGTSSELILDLRGDKTVIAANFVEPTFLVDDGHIAILDGNTYKQVDNSLIIDTVYVDATGKTAGAYTSFVTAYNALPDAGGQMIICGDTAIDTATMKTDLGAKSGKVTVTGQNGAKLIVARRVNLGCEMEIDNIDLCCAAPDYGYIYAQGHKLTIGANVTTTQAAGTSRWITLFGGGEQDYASAHLVVKAGTYDSIYGGNFNPAFTGVATVEVSNVTVKNTLSAKSINTGAFTGTPNLTVDLRGGKTVTATTYVGTLTTLVDVGYEAVLDGMTYRQEKTAQIADTVYVDGTGKTDGAYTTLEAAIAALPDTGGTVVVCGETTVGTASMAETLPAKLGKVTITSANGAKLLINWGLYLGSETEFDNIELVNVSGSMGFICAKGNKLTIGEKVTTSITNSVDRWLSLYGGNNVTSETTSYDAHLIIKAGKWRHIFGGSKGTFNGDAVVEVSNITVTNNLSAKNEAGTFNGDATLIANLCGGKTVTAGKYIQTPTVLVDDGYKAVLNDKTYSQEKLAEDEGTVYVDGTGKTDGAYTTLESAIAALPDAGGKVVVSGDTTVGTSSAALTLPEKSGKVTIIGKNGAKLKIDWGLVLGSETEFDNIELVNISAGQGYISADGNKLTIGEGVTTSRENTDRWLTILGGNKTSTATSYDTDVTIKAGTYRYIFGGNSTATFNGNATVEVSNVVVTKLSAANEGGTFNGTATLTLNLCGNKTVTADTYVGTPTTQTDDGYKAIRNGNTYFQMPESFTSLDTVYVEDGGNGDGSAADKPVDSLAFAHLLLGEDGGKIVLTGDTTVSGAFSFAECTGDVTLTSENGAKLILNGSITLVKNTNGVAFIFDTPIAATDSVIYGGYRNVTFTENCVVTGTLDFYGGPKAETGVGTDTATITELPYTVTVKGGTFRKFSGGSFRKDSNASVGSIAAPLTVNVSGGTFTDTFNLSGDSILADNATLKVSGGTFTCPIYVRDISTYNSATSAYNSDTVKKDRKYYAMDGDVAINISGGTFNGGLISAYNVDKVAYTQLLRGKFTVTVTGGTFAANTEFDATQVKAYAGDTDTLASITYPDTYTFTVIRFDSVNGVVKNYDEPLRVAFIGDSITQGHGAWQPFTESYPAVFASLAWAADRDVVVANYGASGTAVDPNQSYYLAHLCWPIATEETDADYIVLALGTNDHRAGETDAAYIRVENSYTDTVEILGGLPDTEKVFITNAIARGAAENNNTAALRVASVIRPMQERVAKAFAKNEPDKFVFVDLYGLTLHSAAAGPLLGSDNLHPNAEGYVAMAEAMYGAIFNGVTAPASDYRHGEVYLSASGKPYASGTKDDPTSALTQAMALLPYDGEGTIHVVGTYVYSTDMLTSMLPAKLTIVGEGEDAVLEFAGGTFLKALGNVKLDNITLKTTVTDYLLAGNYNNVELTDSVKLEGDWSFAAGFRATAADTVESASSSNDCTISLEGNGGFKNFMLGNYRTSSKAPIGTYSGKLSANVGNNHSASGSLVGAVGQNYLTGSITVSSPINMTEYAPIGALNSSFVYDEKQNTGTVHMMYTGEELSDIVYVDGTGTTTGAYKTLEEAIAALPLTGGSVIVTGDTTVGTSSASLSLPAKSGKVTITGENGAKLKISWGLVLGSETEFDNIELVNISAGQGYISADGNKLTIGENITTSRENTERWLTVLGGNKTSTETSYNTDVTVKAGTYRYIFGGNSTATFNGNATVEVSNIVVTKLSAANEGGTFNGNATLIVNLCGNKTVTATTYAQTPTVLVNDGYKAVLTNTTYSQVKVAIAGDVNGDKTVTVVDALMILKAILNDSTLENADMNGDNKLTLIDVLRVLKAITA